MKRRTPGNSIVPPHRRSLPVLYRALFEIEAMRATVAGMRGNIPPSDAERFLARLDVVEGAALHLLDHAEKRRNVVAH